MQNSDTKLIQEVSWKDVRDSVRAVDAKLADLIDNIDPDPSYQLLKVAYSYGDLILKDGVLQLPMTDRQLLPIDDPLLDKSIKEKLSYSQIPLFLTLHNCNEVFIDTGKRIIPLNLFQPGSLLGLFESVDYMFGQQVKPKWSMSAGARTIFTLPKINESSGLKRLRFHYHLPYDLKIQHFSDHWQLFKLIAAHENFTQTWHNEVLFFTKEWLVKRNGDPHWVEFHDYLFKHAWHQSRFAIGKVDLSLCWETFAEAISSRRLKPTPYLADQIKHIMLIVSGKWPGFKPADDLQKIAPTTGLQKAITEVYSLKQYLPTIMHVDSYENSQFSPIYYSLYFPTLLEGSPNNRSSSTIMLDLRDAKLLLEILKNSFGGNKKFNHNEFQKTQFDYFHVEPDKYNEIKLSKAIAIEDSGFLKEKRQYPARVFCATSPFWRGCIRISSITN